MVDFPKGVSMKLTVFLGLLMSICLLPCVEAFGQSNEKKTCEFNIVGIWRTEATSDTNPVFYGFRQNGSVKILGHVKDTIPQNFEVRAMGGYKLDDPAAPKRLEFTATKGRDRKSTRLNSSHLGISYAVFCLKKKKKKTYKQTNRNL